MPTMHLSFDNAVREAAELLARYKDRATYVVKSYSKKYNAPTFEALTIQEVGKLDRAHNSIAATITKFPKKRHLGV